MKQDKVDVKIDGAGWMEKRLGHPRNHFILFYPLYPLHPVLSYLFILFYPFLSTKIRKRDEMDRAYFFFCYFRCNYNVLSGFYLHFCN